MIIKYNIIFQSKKYAGNVKKCNTSNNHARTQAKQNKEMG